MEALTFEKQHPGLRKLAIVVLVLSIAIAILALCGCSRPSETANAESEEAREAEIKLEDRPYIDAGRPFAGAIATRDYAKAYESLSSHAKARLSPNQFVAPDDEATQKRNEASAVSNPGPDQFAQMLNATEKEYGRPTIVGELNVFSTDPVALSGKGKSMEDKLEAMFAIGMMPESIPGDIRKASLRSKLIVELSSEKLAESAKAYQTTPEKLKADPEFKPYLTLKMVLVEESGAMKVGYFEFLPPGIFD